MPRLIDANELKTIRSIQSADFNSIEAIQKWIDNAPTVDAEPVRHGRWVNHLSEDGATDGIFCSQCDYEIDRDSRPNYCQNCGAKMDEVEE